MRAGIEQQIHSLKGGEHACFIYKDHREQMEAILPFIKAGLEKNESCYYIANDRPLEEVKNSMRSYGIQVEHEMKRGALAFAENNSSGGAFEPRIMVGNLMKLLESVKQKGFSGLRATGEMTWIMGTECGCSQLMEYESLLNENFPTDLTGICQYNRSRFQHDIVRDVLRTHPIVIVGNTICRNLYCDSKKVVAGEDTNDLGVGWMIDNLLKFHTVEEDLRHMIRTRDEFLSVASHELNTPLTALKLQTQLRLRKRELSIEDSNQYDAMTLRNINQLIGIVNGMLEVTHMGSQSSIALKRKEGVDITALASECIQSLDHGNLIHLHRTAPLCGNWDPVRLNQLLFNLFSNAIKYGAGQSVDVEIEERADSVHLSVQDHGSGISPEDQKRIFELYERAVSFTNISGFGIGLYIAKQIVDAHHGSITLESALGQGSTFHVELPRNLPARSP